MNIDEDSQVHAWMVAACCKIVHDAMIVIDACTAYRNNVIAQKLSNG